ncbi:hypothetical protein BX616_009828 [Lobosporangium transversale]|uniref:Uncharacterized protein n=1 Tax=Lobosporangium transversale TaxID=64571 RepID=A0A1Y2H3J5_9FUNG|nr:hypothetical protein BCR41DRAFT_344522 [Lobosporangium transversale]KAF9918232.1 hypothetical protein BX616_009828 [Lobosporangium transversale]ORZ29085.1 hypothetical protein BCR41DRAFT_344522 [Lobosporangium transversale]|eukprot:XP_021886758.1 hypothetical protein BCR41DRAFT_344522 [Lobosporangium transversale]
MSWNHFVTTHQHGDTRTTIIWGQAPPQFIPYPMPQPVPVSRPLSMHLTYPGYTYPPAPMSWPLGPAPSQPPPYSMAVASFPFAWPYLLHPSQPPPPHFMPCPHHHDKCHHRFTTAVNSKPDTISKLKKLPGNMMELFSPSIIGYCADFVVSGLASGGFF